MRVALRYLKCICLDQYHVEPFNLLTKSLKCCFFGNERKCNHRLIRNLNRNRFFRLLFEIKWKIKTQIHWNLSWVFYQPDKVSYILLSSDICLHLCKQWDFVNHQWLSFYLTNGQRPRIQKTQCTKSIEVRKYTVYYIPSPVSLVFSELSFSGSFCEP